jgi:hypothetical protein
LPDEAEWREEFIEEFKLFPKGEFTDQIDATTQYLDFMRHRRHLQMPPDRATAVVVGSSTPLRSSVGKNAIDAIAVRSSRWR